MLLLRGGAMRALTKQQRATMASNIIDAMREHDEHHGEAPGDYADGERYLRDEASDDELIEQSRKWSKWVREHQHKE